jgi:hypothetical protein
MDRKDYEYTKRVGRTAYESAIRDAVGGGGQPLPDVDQHLHPDYALVDHDHEGIEHDHPDYQTQIDDNHNRIDHNEDRINALEHELEALAETKDAGEWELGDDPNQEGIFTMTQTDFTQSTNTLALNSVDTEGVSHGFAKVKVGDYVEVVEEHTTRAVGDYGLYEVTAVGVNTFTCRQEQGKGSATQGSHFLIKFFHLNENLDLAELDARYAQKTHSHNYASSNHTHSDVASHTHNYASSSHTHSYAPTSHTHSDYSASNHSHSVIFRSGTSTNPSLSKGEPFLNTTYNVMYLGT